MDQEEDRLPIGARVKLSKLGEARCPRTAPKTGIIVGGSGFTGSTIRVLLDGNRTATPLHRDYVERAGISQSRPPHAGSIKNSRSRQSRKDRSSKPLPNIGVGLSEMSEPRILLNRSELLERRRRRRKRRGPEMNALINVTVDPE